MKLQNIKFLLLAQNMERGLAFYEAVFGLTVSERSEWWSELKFGDAIIALHGGGEGAPTQSDLSFQVDNIIAACRIIRENGGSIVAEPERREGEPIVLAVFRDTEGNELMLTQWVGG